MFATDAELRAHLGAGQVIPAHPLALDAHRRLDERRQQALTRYYVAAGSGGIAVGVHTTQFQIREPAHGLLAPVLELASRTADEALASEARGGRPRAFAKIAGVVGRTAQAVRETGLARDSGYDAVLLSLGAWRDAEASEMLAHCRAVADVLPVMGFYLQPAVGGRVLGYDFWRAFAEIPNVVAVKIAPFNRYRTLDVVRATNDAGRADIALYTGNDDSIVVDLLTPFPARDGGPAMRVVGGLLGQWAVWTRRAVEMLRDIQRSRGGGAGSVEHGAECAASTVSAAREITSWLALASRLTDANAAIFDARHDFAGCIPGIHEVLRRQGLLAGTWCLDPHEQLSPGQCEEIDRVCAAYPELADDEFVAEHLDEWLR